MYKPKPIDTSTVALPADLGPLVESLAEHVHDVWSCGRISEGWTHGIRRDDGHKTHPGLVPYGELSEGEKDYDRRTMAETIKAIIALGFRIERSTADAEEARRTALQVVRESVRTQLADPAADLNTLLALWRERAKHQATWSDSSELYGLMAKKLLKLGVPLTAGEVLAEAREIFKDDITLRQLQGLALARTGATESANGVLRALYAEGHRDEESLGLLARTHKDLALNATSATDGQRHLRRSFELYAEAYASHPTSYWTGINAASMATLLREYEVARKIARQVMDQCNKLVQTPGREIDDRFWLLATLGEAALNLEEWTSAEGWYRKAAQWSFHRFGDIATTRRQARLLLDGLGNDPTLVDRTMPMPRVVIFAGHMVDAADRPSPRFPAATEGSVRDAVRTKLRDLDGFVGFSSAANGSDILFQETVQELQGESHIVLPYEPEAFCTDMVDIVQAGNWKARFHDVLATAARVVVTSRERMMSGDVSFEYADMVLQGLAMARARELGTEVVGVAVWDGKKGDGRGETHASVTRWRELGIRAEIIGTTEFRKASGIPTPEISPSAEPSIAAAMRAVSKRRGGSRVMSMIFADAVHFSKLTESQVPRFVEHFLGRVAALLAKHPDSAVVKNTWGDGLYIVFTNTHDAGLFALDLAEMASTTRWAEFGLPETLNARIAVHAGPVFKCKDPVLNRISFTGTHVSRAARIEPITPPGEVYASQAFAAISSLEGDSDFRCEFVKQADLAKNYGSFPTYVVRRVRAGDNAQAREAERGPE